MKGAKRLVHIYNKLEEYVLVYTLVIAVIIIGMQVIMRYVFNNSLSWSEEAAKYMFVWLIWLGTSIAGRDKSHIALDLVIGKLKGRIKIAMDIIVKLIWLAMCVFLLVNGIELVQSMIARGKTASAMPWLKVWVVYVAVPFSQGVLGLRLLAQIVDDVRDFISPNRHDKDVVSEIEFEGGEDL